MRGEFDNSILKISNNGDTDDHTSKFKTDSSPDKIKDEKVKFLKESPLKKFDQSEIPLNSILRIGEFKIGCCNGYTIVPKSDPLSLLTLARQLDVDILLWGGTHNVEAYTLEDKFFVNPGSCTGAFNTDWPVIHENNISDNDEVTESIPIEKGVDNSEKSGEEANNDEAKEQQNTTTAKNQENNIDDEEDDEEDVPEACISGSNSPSFCLLDIQGSTCTLYIYIYVDGEVKVDKVIYKKKEELI